MAPLCAVASRSEEPLRLMMAKALKDVKVPGNGRFWPFVLAVMAKEILAKVFEVWLTKPVSRSSAFFISFTALTWFLYHDDPQKMRWMSLYCALGAAFVFFLYRW